jgi:predicted hotdog family 3-hydroxylacyl-ACP dehydratase
MVLVESMIDVDPDAGVVRCGCRLPAASPLVTDGSMPAMLVIEMLAQTAACLKGYLELMKGLPVRPAYLVRIDGLEIGRSPEPGEAVEVEAHEERSLGDYFVYAARAVAGGETIARSTMRFVVEGGG